MLDYLVKVLTVQLWSKHKLSKYGQSTNCPSMVKVLTVQVWSKHELSKYGQNINCPTMVKV